MLGKTYMSLYFILNTLSAYFIIFGVVEFFPRHMWVMAWILTRVLSKLIRYIYHTYTTMGFKFRFYPLDWCRMTAFYILYPAEYFLSVIIILATLPVTKANQTFTINILGFDLDFGILYLAYLCGSLPNFLSTLIYLHSKRRQ